MKYCDLCFMSLIPECYTSQWKSTRCATEQVYTRKAIHMHRDALMHRLQGAEAQGPTLERRPTGCKEIKSFK